MASELRVEALVPGRLDVAFTAPAGITVLFGPSGAGKTTCLSVIAGLLLPQKGSIRLGETSLSGLPPHRRRVGLVFQSLALFPHLSAAKNVAYGAASPADAARWLDRMQVTHVADRRPAQLSGGEAQRVALARALASGPQVLLLDEPFSALDAALRKKLGEDLVALTRELQIPVLLVTHDREDAANLGDQVIVLEHGKITATNSRSP